MENLQENINQPIGTIKTSDFNYNLPDEKIAKYPLAERDSSKLLVWENGNISQTVFKNIHSVLPENSLLVFNNTKVVRARLIFTKETGARIEIFCLEPFAPTDYQLSFQQDKTVEWRCIIGNAKKWKQGKLALPLEIGGKKSILTAEILKKEKDDYIVRFEWDGGLTFSEIIEQAGIIPIPPYLHRESEETDITRYQTVFAKIKGSVAAPTAGLHFTDSVLENLNKHGIKTTELTLHVGAGTFQPVKSETIGGHQMHSETVVVSLSFLKKLYAQDKKIIAVGTTSVRSLESLYWIGIQLIKYQTLNIPVHVSQWEAYANNSDLPPKQVLKTLIDFLETNGKVELLFTTQIIIVPGYRFRIIDGMFTNFHQPQSTLLLLIAAFLGENWKKVYDYAMENGFRFLSYGDSNLYLR